MAAGAEIPLFTRVTDQYQTTRRIAKMEGSPPEWQALRATAAAYAKAIQLGLNSPNGDPYQQKIIRQVLDSYDQQFAKEFDTPIKRTYMKPQEIAPAMAARIQEAKLEAIETAQNRVSIQANEMDEEIRALQAQIQARTLKIQQLEAALKLRQEFTPPNLDQNELRYRPQKI